MSAACAPPSAFRITGAPVVAALLRAATPVGASPAPAVAAAASAGGDKENVNPFAPPNAVALAASTAVPVGVGKALPAATASTQTVKAMAGRGALGAGAKPRLKPVTPTAAAAVRAVTKPSAPKRSLLRPKATSASDPQPQAKRQKRASDDDDDDASSSSATSDTASASRSDADADADGDTEQPAAAAAAALDGWSAAPARAVAPAAAVTQLAGAPTSLSTAPHSGPGALPAVAGKSPADWAAQANAEAAAVVDPTATAKQRAELAALTAKLWALQAKRARVERHIGALHAYNEIKDVTQALMGKLAELEHTTTRELYDTFGLALED